MSSMSPPRILVVDDDPSIRLLCARALSRAGYVVLEAAGSSEAMSLYAARTEPIDLLLIDLFLPHLISNCAPLLRSFLVSMAISCCARRSP
jgi:DNA-binding response OmpR family regulator